MVSLDETYQPEYDSLKELLIQMASERSVPALLRLIVTHMTLRPHVALVRIFLKKPADICHECSMAKVCAKHTECLHLEAAGGRSIADPAADWSDVNGHGRRMPLGYGGIGTVAVKGRGLSGEEVEQDPQWQTRHLWAANEGIAGFGAQPVVFKSEILGVIAVYSRIKACRVKEGDFWLRMIAHQLAAAISNARAFNEIAHLKSQLELENAYLREEIDQARSFGDIVGSSEPLMAIIRQIQLVAPTDASVFISGESGTGKELVAREIHRRSRRRDRPMIKVNCAAIPGELYESEFFGHVRGAFTGAVKNRAGRFQAADTGTLFLDEVGELPLSLQGKLLRVLQEGAYERIGDDTTRNVDVRIIAATNRNIKQDIEAGRFRRDLYYRLNVFPIEIPSLRQRREDIRPLAFHFLHDILAGMNLGPKHITDEGMNRLLSYDWPGNVRELRNLIERSVIISKQAALEIEFSAPELSSNICSRDRQFNFESHGDIKTDAQVKQMVKQNIHNALRACNGKIYGSGGAARLLGMAPTTLSSRIRTCGIVPAVYKQR